MSLFTTARSAVGVVTRHNDINIVFLLVTVIALMIIPLPTPVVMPFSTAQATASSAYALEMLSMTVSSLGRQPGQPETATSRPLRWSHLARAVRVSTWVKV